MFCFELQDCVVNIIVVQGFLANYTAWTQLQCEPLKFLST